MRRLPSVSDDSAPNVNYPLGVQSRIRIFLPPEASAFTAIVQISSEADVDESLQGPKGLARVGVAVVVHPSPPPFIHPFYKLPGRYLHPPPCEAFYLSSGVSLPLLSSEDVDGHLSP